MTAEKLDPVTTTLKDIQNRLKELITPDTILVGHSLESDLKALKLVHPVIVDTAMLYPHPRGGTLKSSLKFLTSKYLSREIQRGNGSTGHDSVEDALAPLDLVKQKCERGPKWGTNEATGESIFLRLGRSFRPQQHSVGGVTDQPRTGAVVDYGNPQRGHGSRATTCIGCRNDMGIVSAVKKAVNGDGDNEAYEFGGADFTWARLRELEFARGFDKAWKTGTANEHPDTNGTSTESAPALGEVVRNVAQNGKEIYEALPPCTAFIVYSGNGDPREFARLQMQHQQYRDEYKTKKWDELSVKWTDVEEQALKQACTEARRGVGFVVVK